MMMPTWSLQEFVIAIAQADSYPFYGVLLYTPMNGLDGRMHQYVTDHWSYLNRLTGHSCLVFAIENIDQAAVETAIFDFDVEKKWCEEEVKKQYQGKRDQRPLEPVPGLVVPRWPA